MVMCTSEFAKWVVFMLSVLTTNHTPKKYKTKGYKKTLGSVSYCDCGDGIMGVFYMPKLIKLYILNMPVLSDSNYTSTKLLLLFLKNELVV